MIQPHLPPGKNKIPVNLLIITHCAYTATGIKELCTDFTHWRVNCISSNRFELKEILIKQPIDLLILEVGNMGKEMMTLFSLPYSYQNKTILLTHRSSCKLRDLGRLAGVNAVVDKLIPLDLLKCVLHSAVCTLQEHTVLADHQIESQKLERVVLRALLSGLSQKKLATALGITTAAVSRYKMIALRRMGMTSLNEVITGN
ncbi:MAG: LuxR C-terminal-related transcriptional regulator [Serratia sp. (in: enterobacteria)]|uniref:LuxR C-terminal-related transcriptional regulator n=1 Tax=Serratia sp. (in: enterobacteria) TaxID=616 RepID=UPI003F392A55